MRPQTEQAEHAPSEVAAGEANRRKRRGGNRGRGSAKARTIRAINATADARREVRDGHELAGWRAICRCGWKTVGADKHAALREHVEHERRFENDRHALALAVPEVGGRDLLAHPNAVEHLTSELDGLYVAWREETAPEIRARAATFYGHVARFREEWVTPSSEPEGDL